MDGGRWGESDGLCEVIETFLIGLPVLIRFG